MKYKYSINEKVVDIFDNSKKSVILDQVPNHGMYDMPFYKLSSKNTKSGIVWCPEWMLISNQ